MVISEVIYKVQKAKKIKPLDPNSIIEFRYRFLEDFDKTYFANFVSHKHRNEIKRETVLKSLTIQFLQYANLFDNRDDKLMFCRKFIKCIEIDKEGFFKDEPDFKEGLLILFRAEWDSLRRTINQESKDEQFLKFIKDFGSKVENLTSLENEIHNLIENLKQRKKKGERLKQKMNFSEIFINPKIGLELKCILKNSGYLDNKDKWLGQTQAKNELSIAYYVLKQAEHGFQLIKTGDKKNQLITFYNEFGLTVTTKSEKDTYTTLRNLLTEPSDGDTHEQFKSSFRPLLKFKN